VTGSSPLIMSYPLSMTMGGGSGIVGDECQILCI
jgi:hypothetical protein